MTFGEKLRQSRNAKKMTQKQLANLVGAKHNSISDWENDKNKPDPDTIELLCGVLEITPNYLLNANSEDFSFTEKEMIRKFRKLDVTGKDLVTSLLDKVYDMQHPESFPGPTLLDYLDECERKNFLSAQMPNAAHDRTDIEVTDEMKEHDDKFFDED